MKKPFLAVKRPLFMLKWGEKVGRPFVTGALLSEEGLALSKLGLTYGGLKDKVRRETLKSVKDELLKE